MEKVQRTPAEEPRTQGWQRMEQTGARTFPAETTRSTGRVFGPVAPQVLRRPRAGSSSRRGTPGGWTRRGVAYGSTTRFAPEPRIGWPFPPCRFRNERYTHCEAQGRDGEQIREDHYDNWRVNGEDLIGPERWTGYTVLVFQGRALPWEDLGSEAGSPSSGATGPGAWQSPSEDESAGEAGDPGESRAGGSRWTSFQEEGLDGLPKERAYAYIAAVDGIQDGQVADWRKVRRAGDELLEAAGTVERAATALWIAREASGRNNLAGVDDESLDGLLHPDHLAYLRDVRAQGMSARYVGERERVASKLHPRAKENLCQVYVQVMKDVKKQRVLVVSNNHPGLASTVSSPFETVPKMLPNRTLSTDVRLVHDQRRVNQGTDKTLHPPAAQPSHAQVARRILWLKARYPGTKVVLAKKDVAGAFRLLWVDPKDVELFGGDIPWAPSAVGGGEGEPAEAGLTA